MSHRVKMIKQQKRADLVKGTNTLLVNYRVPRVVVTAKNITSVSKQGKPLPKNLSGFTKVINVKKSNIIQAKSTKKKNALSKQHKEAISKGLKAYHACARKHGCGK